MPHALRLLNLIIGLTALLALPAVAPAAGPPDLRGELAAIAEHAGVGRMRVGVRVVRLGGAGELVYEQRPNEPFKPASNEKLLTSAAALNLLPDSFTYRTVLAVRGDDLVIVGAGDPSIGDPRLAKEAREPVTAVFHRWAEKLQAAGITSVAGNLIFDDHIFEQEHVHPSWRGQFNLETWYAAPVGGLNFNDNCVDVVIERGAANGKPAVVRLVPDTPWVGLTAGATTAAKGQPIIKRLGAGPITISVTGSVSTGNTSDPFSVAIVDPGAYFASTARTALAAKGIRITGDTRRERVRRTDGTLPDQLRIIAVHESSIPDWLWRVNKSSQNMFAEALFKTVGAYAHTVDRPRVGGNDTARAAVRDYLAALKVPLDGCVFDDGSGLSHENRVTPALLVAVLRSMDRHPRRNVWLESLAVPGEEEGTLRRRLKDLADSVHAKTGTISGVSSLSGYVTDKSGQRYAFSILCNDTERAKGGTSAAHKIQDDICRKLAGWKGARETGSQVGG